MENVEKIKKKQYMRSYARVNPVGEFLPKGAEAYYDAQLYFLNNFFSDGVKNKKVLDIGTGAGFVDDYLLKIGATDIDTLDINESFYESALKKYSTTPQIRPLYGDITTYKFDSRYDLVVAFDVIEHLPVEEGIEMLKKIYSLLNPGGMCVIRTENMANIFLGNYSRYIDITHATGYTEMSLRQAFWGAGFSECIVVDPHFKRFSRLWINYKISRFIQKILINLQDRRIPKCMHKDLLCYTVKS